MPELQMPTVERILHRYGPERLAGGVRAIEAAGYRLSSTLPGHDDSVWWCVGSAHVIEPGWEGTTEASPPAGARDCAECGELAVRVYAPPPLVMPDARSQRAAAADVALAALDACGAGIGYGTDRVHTVEIVGRVRADLGDLVCVTSAADGSELTVDIFDFARHILWPES
jgi:hypothetical protein